MPPDGRRDALDVGLWKGAAPALLNTAIPRQKALKSTVIVPVPMTSAPGLMAPSVASIAGERDPPVRHCP